MAKMKIDFFKKVANLLKFGEEFGIYNFRLKESRLEILPFDLFF